MLRGKIIEIFELLRKERPQFANDIIPISGSLDELELAISKEDQAMLAENIQLIIHSAADVRFDIPIANATIRNIRGTRELLKLAQKMNNLENFIHISTAYAFCMRKVIGEEFYETPFDSEVVIRMAENMTSEDDQTALVAFRDKIIHPWPNTYTFTKAITELMVRKYEKHFKITVIKPSIVTATFREPIPGWASNFSGANGVFAGIVGGVLRCFKIQKDIAIDMVYGDYVVNGALAAGHDISIGGNIGKPPIYNIVSSNDYVTTFDQMVDEILPLRLSVVPSKALWFPTCTVCRDSVSFFLCNLFFHIIPAVLFDLGLLLKGKKPQIIKLYRQIHSFGDVINFFICSTFKFENKNMKRVCKSLTLADKQIFPCDFADAYWPEYRDCYVKIGITQSLLNDKSDEKTLNRNSTIWKFIHYGLLSFGALCTAFFFYVVFK
ncbi:fatty acyl-CoA reductase wat-like isoform X2 [Bradysia coprophila]|uniref:fatty acyl-CoA reductase wat-like isoform X2 n=1 Tax=Bradysia coprophila TaxID=38358 RepID=UPI00187D9625|nr:fatty acyl-CoA reductase wat-like isoform X2 [Bradysia coprophila]